MEEVYAPPVIISEFGKSDHKMVLLKPSFDRFINPGV